jgi:Icc-related predicted phosphoesterase
MRIVCVSDTHGIAPLPAIPPCDLLLHAGDVEALHLHPHDGASQRRYLEQVFAPWLEAAPARHKVGIVGNHDFLGESEPDVLRALPWHYLCDESVEIEGLTIHGSPWTPPFYDWAFMLPEQDLAEKWALVPARCDVLLTHGPPYGLGDRVSSRHAMGRDPHQGSQSLRAAVEALPALRLHAFGHIHEGYGQGVLERPGLEPLPWLNAASVDERYASRNSPIAVELSPRG